jgi:hypothetical protein
MDFSKLNNGQKVGIIGGLVLIVNLFLPWYGAFGITINAFDSGFLAWFGSLLGIAGAVILAGKAFGWFALEARGGAFKAEQIAFLFAAVGTVFVVLRWITESDITKFGLYLGIVAAAVTAVGAFLAMKEAGLSMPDLDDFKPGGSGGGE